MGRHLSSQPGIVEPPDSGADIGTIKRMESVREEDWSWVNIGRALSAAGIQFKTGKAWTGENVRRAVDLAMKPRKAPGTKQATTPFTPTAPVSTPVTPVLASAAPKGGGEPEFRIIRRGPGAPVRAEAGGTPSESSKQGEP